MTDQQPELPEDIQKRARTLSDRIEIDVRSRTHHKGALRDYAEEIARALLAERRATEERERQRAYDIARRVAEASRKKHE